MAISYRAERRSRPRGLAALCILNKCVLVLYERCAIVGPEKTVSSLVCFLDSACSLGIDGGRIAMYICGCAI